MASKGPTSRTSRPGRSGTAHAGTRVLLGVYGTLRQGFENHARFLQGRAPVAEGFLSLPFRMFATAAYPMIVPSAERRPLYVEVFDIGRTTLARIDRFERRFGYRRETVDCPEVGGGVELFVYAGSPVPDGFTEVESGRWVPPSVRPMAVPPRSAEVGNLDSKVTPARVRRRKPGAARG